MTQFEKIKCRINFRETVKGCDCDPLVKQLNGIEMTFTPTWFGNANDHYPKEWACYAVDEADALTLRTYGLAYIASGDLLVDEKN
jgi:hypothetical protein